MVYLEFEKDTKLVVQIHENYPNKVREGHEIATSKDFEIGMELEYVITVDTINQDGRVIASSTTKQTVPAYQLLNKVEELQSENNELKQENTILKAQNNALSERADFIEDVVAEIAIQVYQ